MLYLNFIQYNLTVIQLGERLLFIVNASRGANYVWLYYTLNLKM